MALAVLLAVAGLVLLTFAADHLVIGSSRIASRMRISPVVVGVVVIGLGTSSPEFLVSGIAAARGDSGIAIGSIAGSNLLNVTLILGVAAMIGAVRASATVVRREIPLAVLAVAALAATVWVTGLTTASGSVLGVAAVVALWLLVRWARRDRSQKLAEEAATLVAAPAGTTLPTAARLPETASIPATAELVAGGRPRAWFEPIRALLGLAGVLAGAQLLVSNAATIAEHFGVAQVVIGVTLVAIGTSVPELVTAIAAQRRGESDLVVGNLFGSNLFNSLAGGAVIGLANGPIASDLVPMTLLVAMVVANLIAWVLLRRGLSVNRMEGAVLLIVYLVALPVLVIN